MPEAAVIKKRFPLISLIVIVAGMLVFAAGIIWWRVGGIDKYIKTVNFSVTDQPVDKINRIEIDVSSVKLEVRRGGDKLSVVGENMPEETVYGTEGDTFRVKDKTKMIVFLNSNILRWFSDVEEAKLTITVPDKMFDKVEFDLGVGEANVSGINAKEMEIDSGTGSFTGKDLNISGTLDIDSGTGEVKLENCNVGKLDIDSGVGALSFSGKVTDGLDADCGVGETDITIYGNYNDYDVDADAGIGKVNIEKGDTSHSGSGKIPVKVDGGIGEVNIRFVSE